MHDGFYIIYDFHGSLRDESNIVGSPNHDTPDITNNRYTHRKSFNLNFQIPHPYQINK